MDFVPNRESFFSPEFIKSAFTDSAFSLYMSDQKLYDKQCKLNSQPPEKTCTSPDVTTLPTESDFDLSSQLEKSNSLEGVWAAALGCFVEAGTIENASTPTKKPRLAESDIMISSLKKGEQESAIIERNSETILSQNFIHNVFSFQKENSPMTPLLTRPFLLDEGKQTSPTQSDIPEKRLASHKCVRSRQSTSVQEMSQSETGISLSTNDSAVVSASPVPTIHSLIEPTDPHGFYTMQASHTQNIVQPLRGQLHSTDSVGTDHSDQEGTRGRLVKSESVEEKWKEIQQFIHNPESACKRKRKASDGSAIVSDEESFKSKTGPVYFINEDSDSDGDSDVSDTPFEESLIELAKNSKQYFWQYNIQAKGPKGSRLQLSISDTDPHCPSHFEDPVFDSNNISLVGIRHGGKARKGDGNVVTPNPRKLFQIGQKLCRLNREISSYQITNDLPDSIRNKSRKEKNKLSSRACRLKKKAAHEANKVKLFGLDCEQGDLLQVSQLIRQYLKERVQQQMKSIQLLPSDETFAEHINNIIVSHYKTVIAGNTADYVNKIIAKVEEGDPDGGLSLKPQVKK